MKKNISINLYGTIYQIDEDAYDLLERYLNSMKSYFSRKEGGEEIADDIEHRVAELLWEKREAGQEAVNIDTIKEIIDKIGDPEQIDNNDTTELSFETSSNEENTDDNTIDNKSFDDTCSSKDSTFEKPEFTENATYTSQDNIFEKMRKNANGRRLYRDIYTNIIGGVCSGFANYLGGDPTIWRLGAVFGTIAFSLVSGWCFVPGIIGWAIPIAYIVLWIVLPVVRTPEDMLRMRGEEVNPQNLNQEILKESDGKARQQQQFYYPQSNNDGCMKAAGVGCLVILALLFIFILLPIIFFSIVMGGLTTGGLFGGTSLLGTLFTGSKVIIWASILCFVLVLLIPIFFLIRMLVGSRKPLGTVVIVISIIIWLIALVAGIFMISKEVGQAIRNYDDDMEIIDDSTFWADDDSFYYDEEVDTLDCDSIPAVIDSTDDEQVNMTVNHSKVSISTPDAKLSVSPKGVKIQTTKNVKSVH